MATIVITRRDGETVTAQTSIINYLENDPGYAVNRLLYLQGELAIKQIVPVDQIARFTVYVDDDEREETEKAK